MATKLCVLAYLAALLLFIGCAPSMPDPLPPPPSGVESIKSPGEVVSLELTELPGYSHTRGSTVIRFPLYKGAKWRTTLSAVRDDWTVVVEVTEITDEVIDGEKLRIARLKFTDNNPMPGGSSRMGECWYSPAKKKIVRCQ